MLLLSKRKYSFVRDILFALSCVPTPSVPVLQPCPKLLQTNAKDTTCRWNAEFPVI